MAKFLSPKEYWQVRADGQIMEVCAQQEERSMEWHKAYRQVRLYHHAESGIVFVEDYHAPAYLLQQHHENQAEEVDRETYNYWKMIYENPDI